MEWDYDRKKEKEAEFIAEIENKLRLAEIPEEQIKATAKEFFEKSVNVTPPEKKAMVIKMITTPLWSGWRTKYQSRKHSAEYWFSFQCCIWWCVYCYFCSSSTMGNSIRRYIAME